MRLLLIDNYDSFTYNLVQLLAEAAGGEPTVARNDEIPTAAIARRDFDGIVLSPGPGRPDEEADFGGCAAVIREATVPLLGVCLGHQGIATAFGGAVDRIDPVHGRATAIRHDGAPMFAGAPSGFPAVRYHSLAARSPLPDCLRATAWSDDGTVMALEHRRLPIWGMQFHPESAGTPLGRTLLGNFVGLVDRHADRAPRRSLPTRTEAPTPTGDAAPRVIALSLPRLPDPASAFARLFGDAPYAFWIDREASPSFPGGAGRTVMGSAAAPGSELLTGTEGDGTIFEVLRQRLRDRRTPGDPEFEFAGGYVGYLGYELKSHLGSAGRHSSPVPDACLIYASRLLVIDHRSGEAHVIAVVGPDEDQVAAERDLEAMRRSLESMPAPGELRPSESAGGGGDEADAEPVHALDRDEYLDAIAAARRCLEAGESYEICLTNRIDFPVDPEVDPLDLYLELRRRSPAPQAAFLRCGSFAVLSASPERFLRIDRDGTVEARPIKGTRPRGDDPKSDRELRGELLSSAKDRAENLMIVDVLRNDLGRVCEVGSVEVDGLMEVESFAQVHQLVSTIRGRLADGRDPVECVESCFPGGSMTGAPKLRTMEILDRLEPVARGPYSGALGWFGLDGAVDLSIVIRTIVIDDGLATIGSGGAITVLSDPEEEYAEMLLKAEPLVELLSGAACGSAREAISATSPPRRGDST
ncbi:MAG: aminodeoxychorismate synthase component I [Actinobacteria bacterium]|nr:aminodeoxychorismate synthase component I [Actinomycetota bacterium]